MVVRATPKCLASSEMFSDVGIGVGRALNQHAVLGPTQVRHVAEPAIEPDWTPHAGVLLVGHDAAEPTMAEN
jgi:hypothetical protein